jgi:hypothetical protein
MGFPHDSRNEVQDIDNLVEIGPMANLRVPDVELSDFSLSGPTAKFSSDPEIHCFYTHKMFFYA